MCDTATTGLSLDRALTVLLSDTVHPRHTARHNQLNLDRRQLNAKLCDSWSYKPNSWGCARNRQVISNQSPCSVNDVDFVSEVGPARSGGSADARGRHCCDSQRATGPEVVSTRFREAIHRRSHTRRASPKDLRPIFAQQHVTRTVGLRGALGRRQATRSRCSKRNRRRT
jgi:hypothetical protein